MQAAERRRRMFPLDGALQEGKGVCPLTEAVSEDQRKLAAKLFWNLVVDKSAGLPLSPFREGIHVRHESVESIAPAQFRNKGLLTRSPLTLNVPYTPAQNSPYTAGPSGESTSRCVSRIPTRSFLGSEYADVP